jgi:SAM-dependent methyltransferase
MTRFNESEIWDFFWGPLAARALALAADHRVADALADGPRHVEELARDIGADTDALRRILRALASRGVFAEDARGVFRNTEASEALRGEDGLGDFAHLFGGVWHRAAGELTLTQRPSFPQIHGADFWTWLAAHPTERSAFDRAMARSREWKANLLDGVEWRGDEVLVDVGGGNGALLAELLRRRTGLRGIVFDLPDTTREETDQSGERLAFIQGSFFDGVPSADAYVLSTILHDWDDEGAARILRAIHSSASAGARLLVLDAVVPEGNEPHGAKWLDLLMLALFGGRERDELQWRTLLEANGFEPVAISDGLVEARSI